MVLFDLDWGLGLSEHFESLSEFSDVWDIWGFWDILWLLLYFESHGTFWSSLDIWASWDTYCSVLDNYGKNGFITTHYLGNIHLRNLWNSIRVKRLFDIFRVVIMRNMSLASLQYLPFNIAI